MSKLRRESREIAIIQAAQFKDPSICDGFQDEEEEQDYQDYVKWFDELREQYGNDLSGIEIDIPYSYEDYDDEDEDE